MVSNDRSDAGGASKAKVRSNISEHYQAVTSTSPCCIKHLQQAGPNCSGCDPTERESGQEGSSRIQPDTCCRAGETRSFLTACTQHEYGSTLVCRNLKILSCPVVGDKQLPRP